MKPNKTTVGGRNPQQPPGMHNKTQWDELPTSIKWLAGFLPSTVFLLSAWGTRVFVHLCSGKAEASS